MSSLVEQANDKPWLYAVYVLVIVLPLIFLVTWCCRSSDKVGEQKKTDAPQPDDEHNSDQEAEVSGLNYCCVNNTQYLIQRFSNDQNIFKLIDKNDLRVK